MFEKYYDIYDNHISVLHLLLQKVANPHAEMRLSDQDTYTFIALVVRRLRLYIILYTITFDKIAISINT